MTKYLMQKSQIAIEFIVVIVIVFTITFVFMLSAVDSMQEISLYKEGRAVRDMARSLQEEVVFAATVEDGYFRNFTVPSTLQGIAYNISQSNNSLIVESTKASSIVRIPPVTGVITKGDNIIRKSGGDIYLN